MRNMDSFNNVSLSCFVATKFFPKGSKNVFDSDQNFASGQANFDCCVLVFHFRPVDLASRGTGLQK